MNDNIHSLEVDETTTVEVLKEVLEAESGIS
jgi:hypothetical protein